MISIASLSTHSVPALQVSRERLGVRVVVRRTLRTLGTFMFPRSLDFSKTNIMQL